MKKVFLIVLLILSVSFTSASFSNPTSYNYKEKISKTEYYPNDALVVSVTKYANYDNEDRYSTYDYRHGYSYRTTEDYWDSQYAKNKRLDYDYDYRGPRRGDSYSKGGFQYDYDYRDGDSFRGWNGPCYDNHGNYCKEDRPSYYYEYSPGAGGYKEGKCYEYAPRNKIIYVKCP